MGKRRASERVPSSASPHGLCVKKCNPITLRASLAAAMADVLLTHEALDDIGRLPHEVRRRVDALLVRLRAWPVISGARPLRGELAGAYRMRTGDYRVQFRAHGPTVIVEKIGHRDGFYEA